MSDYYNTSGYPTPNAPGDSASARGEFTAIAAAMNKLPTISGNGGKVVRVNAGATALESVDPGSVIDATAAKTTMADADEQPLADSAASFAQKKITWANFRAALFATIGSMIAATTIKTTPVDADSTLIQDSAAAGVNKQLTWANIKATLRATLVSTVVGTPFQISADASPLWWGTQSTLASGTAYILNGNIKISEAWCHNTAIDASGNFVVAYSTNICTAMFWGDDDVLRVFVSPVTNVGVVPTFGATPTYTLDMKTGIITPAPIDAFPNFTSTVAANALTGILTSPLRLNFRNATIGTGTPVGLSITSNLTLTVPSGATLGTVNAITARLAWLVAYNGGSPVLCVINLAGGLQLDETNLISPTTISGTSNSAGVIYSASAVGANSPYRVIGFTDITEATAGTWATAPSTVQPVGGQALSLSSFGCGQTWQNVGASRAIGTTYYNQTGRTIWIQASITLPVTGAAAVNINVAGNIIGSAANNLSGTNIITPISFPVGPGESYSISSSSGSPTISSWWEKR